MPENFIITNNLDYIQGNIQDNYQPPTLYQQASNTINVASLRFNEKVQDNVNYISNLWSSTIELPQFQDDAALALATMTTSIPGMKQYHTNTEHTNNLKSIINTQEAYTQTFNNKLSIIDKSNDLWIQKTFDTIYLRYKHLVHLGIFAAQHSVATHHPNTYANIKHGLISTGEAIVNGIYYMDHVLTDNFGEFYTEPRDFVGYVAGGFHHVGHYLHNNIAISPFMADVYSLAIFYGEGAATGKIIEGIGKTASAASTTTGTAFKTVANSKYVLPVVDKAKYTLQEAKYQYDILQHYGLKPLFGGEYTYLEEATRLSTEGGRHLDPYLLKYLEATAPKAEENLVINELHHHHGGTKIMETSVINKEQYIPTVHPETEYALSLQTKLHDMSRNEAIETISKLAPENQLIALGYVPTEDVVNIMKNLELIKVNILPDAMDEWIRGYRIPEGYTHKDAFDKLTNIAVFVTKEDTVFHKVFTPSENNPNGAGRWLTTKENLAGLTAEQSSVKLALIDYIPSHISRAVVPKGKVVAIGIIREQAPGSGGGIQFYLMDEWNVIVGDSKQWFKNVGTIEEFNKLKK